MPLVKSASKKAISFNIKEMMNAGHPQNQSIAAALSTARKYARKAEGGADLEDPRMKAIGIRPVEGTPNAPVQAPPEQGSWGPPVAATPAPQPAMSEDDLTKAYLKQLSGTETPASPGKVVSDMAHGLVDWVKSPGEMMKGPEQVQHATPGMETEEESFLQNLNNQSYDRQMTDFAAGTAMGNLGMARMPGMVPEGAIGAGGSGPPKKSATAVHPQPNEHGEPVEIKNPTPPTPIDNLPDPSKPFTFSVGNMTVPQELNGIPFKPWAPPEGGWVEHFSNYDDPIHETKFVDHPTKQAASGVVILEPDGRMWLTAPTNQFGGYKSTFPKGKLDPGLTMQENAIKEAYEETGLKVRLMGQLADVDKTTSRTRYYLATRESGTPTAMGWESQAVHLVPWSKAKEFLNNPLDHQVLDSLAKKAAELKKGPAPEPPQSAAPPAAPAKNVPEANGKYFGKYFHPYDLNPEDVKKFTFQKGNHETGGTNPGGVYHAPDGTPVYLKQFEGDHVIERTYNEKLANELLKLAGVPVADVRMTQLKGYPAIASYMVPGKELNTVPSSQYNNLKGLREHYPAHLWTGNYDFVGTGKNNIMVMPNGQTIHIDPGGALRYRAQGKLKGPDMWGPNVEHFDFNKGYDLGQVMKGHLNDPELIDSAKRVAAITDDQIHGLVQQYGPLQKGEKAKLEETLKARRDGVAKMYGVDKGGASAPPISGPQKSTPAYDMDTLSFNEAAEKLPQHQKDLLFKKAFKEKVNENYGPKIGTPYDPKGLAQHYTMQYKGDPYKIASKIFEIQQEHGWDVADAVGAQLTQTNGLRQAVGDHLDAMGAKIGKEPDHFAMWDDPDDPGAQPPSNLMSEDWHNNNYYSHDFNFHGTPWFAKNTKNMFPHSEWTVERIEKEIKAGDSGIFRILDNKQWQDYRPPTQEHPKLIVTPNAMVNPKEHGFNRFTEIHHNTNHPGSSGYLEQVFHPKNKKKVKGTQYDDEYALYGLDRKFHGYATYQTGPYLLNPSKVMEAYWPNLKGDTYAEKGNHGSGSSGALQKKIIEAAHHQGVDLVILHGMNDIGGENQSQYLILNEKIMRAKDAKFDPSKFGKSAKDPATGLDYSNTMWGIAGASAVGAGLAKGQKQDEDKKMARGGKVKFKPFSSIENLTGLDEGYRHKPYKKTEGAGKKAMRTAKHFARGGATEPEPKEHEFINFAKGGMINSNIPGRTDKIPMKVATGAYVLPADIPSALGQGNTIAGKTILDKMFNSGPYGLPLAKGKPAKFQMPHLKGFAQGGRAAAEKALPANHELGMKVPKGGSSCASCSFYKGNGICGNKGFAQWHGSDKIPQPADQYCCDLYAHTKKMADGGATDHTPIIAAGGEYIVNPDEVMRQGNGSMTAGHKVLDAFVLHTRKKHIETLKGLKGPK